MTKIALHGQCVCLSLDCPEPVTQEIPLFHDLRLIISHYDEDPKAESSMNSIRQ